MKVIDAINSLVDMGYVPKNLILFTGKRPGTITVSDLQSSDWKIGINPGREVDDDWYASHSISNREELSTLLRFEDLENGEEILLTSKVVESYPGSPSRTGITGLGMFILRTMLPEVATVLAKSRTPKTESPKESNITFKFTQKEN